MYPKQQNFLPFTNRISTVAAARQICQSNPHCRTMELAARYSIMTTKILGIESSCDETAAAVVSDGLEVLSNVVASQIDIHQKYGGVVPELASREHLRQIVPVVREALAQAQLKLNDLDAIAVTQGPGLVGALLVGITYGKTLAASLQKPLIPVNHLEGHVHAVFLEAHRTNRQAKFPAVCLIVSGGHTVLYEVTAARSKSIEIPGAKNRPDVSFRIPPPFQAGEESAVRQPSADPVKFLSYRKIAQTRDDAAGEAYDKVAKLLSLGYPGGPILDRLAAVSNGTPPPVKFSPTKVRGNPLDFSFSGLKTAVLYHLREHPEYSAGIHAREAALARGEKTFDQLTPALRRANLGAHPRISARGSSRPRRPHHCSCGVRLRRVHPHLRRSRRQQ